MQKILFDEEIINNHLSVLNNTLDNQRQIKKTLLSYLEKFSNEMYDNFNSDSTDILLSLIKEAHSVFEYIKSNISKTIELKHFLENISKSAFLNTFDSEKFNIEFNSLLENISKTNSDYLQFMNNYENFINQNFKTKINELQQKSEPIQIPQNNFQEISENNRNSNIDLKIPQNTNDELSNFENNNEKISNFTNNENNIEELVALNTPQNNLSDSYTLEENPLTDENDIFNTEDIIDENFFSTYLQEKVLIINRKKGIAILPYSISDLDEVFLDNPEKYSSIQDIIDKEYTISLNDYENTSISRYKEAFKLAKDKSNYSFSQAANFAKNLLIETRISTLLIAAFKDVKELEFYLECLNSNQIDSFTSFKIIEQ